MHYTSRRISIAAVAFAVVPMLAHAQDRKAEPPARRPAVATQRPAAAAAVQTASCKDGTTYSGAGRQGACANHGGVRVWTTDHMWAANVTAHCNDGTDYTAASRQGACSAHGGVKKWRVDDDDDAAKPRDAKARCNDGSWWTAVARQGACANHGGVHHWLRRH